MAEESDSASVTGQESSDQKAQSVSGDISNVDIVKEIRAMSQKMDQKLDQLDRKMEEMSGKIFELYEENDQLKKEIVALKKREESLERVASEAKHQASLADRRVNELEQYTRRNNIRVFGVPDEDKETADQCEKKVLKIFHDKLGLRDVTSQDLEATHRVGQKAQADRRPRPIIVRSVSRKTTQSILANKKKLKGTDFMIVEDLTTENYRLLKSCKDHPNAVSAWSRMGKIFVKTLDLQILAVEKLTDVTCAEIDMNAVSASTPRTVVNTFAGRGRGRGGYARQQTTGAPMVGNKHSSQRSDASGVFHQRSTQQNGSEVIRTGENDEGGKTSRL